MDAELAQALIADKALSLALLVVGIGVLWRRYSSSSDKLLAVITAQTAELAGKLGEVKTALEVGLAGLAGKIDAHDKRLQDHDKRLAEHSRTLDRHAALIEVMHGAERSGIYSRPRAVGEEDRG